ncbi:MAG: hypothetical protein CSA29_05770 [Desulfobacterales bacterium]|nr:MAG: hypothetical protein CSA29_05770 [Desulfobacterales bacterium]
MKGLFVRRRIFIALIGCFILQWGLAWGGSVWADAVNPEKKILITPFQITSQENLEFLKKGIEKMLEARLTEPGTSSVVFGDDDDAAKRLGADYIVKGTILIFGSQVNTDVKLLEADTGKAKLEFNEMGTEKGDVIKHMDLFAENIRTQALGLKPVAGLAAPVPTGGYAKQPEQLAQTRSQEIWRGPFWDKEITAICLADIEGDGKTETLVLSGAQLDVYRRTPKGFAPVSSYKLPQKGVTFLFVDAYDLENDGTKEILITGVDNRWRRPAAFAYRFERGTWVEVGGPYDYFLRVVDTREGPLLLGQKADGPGDKKLNTPVVELKMGPGRQGLVPGEKTFPFIDNVFGVAFGDFMNNGNELIASLGLDGYLSLFSPDGQLLNKSAETFGGTPAYIEYKGHRFNKDDGYVLSRVFLQQRVFAGDVDQDGKTNLIVVKNIDKTGGFLTKTRIFTKSYIDILTWNELGFESGNRTQHLNGFISDYTVGDMDSDGKDEIVFALVNTPKLLGAKRSQIFAKR